MSCNLTSGYTPLCRYRGGVDMAVVFQRKALDSVTVTNGEAVALTLKSGNQAFAFEIDPELSSFEDVATSNENRALFSAQTATMILLDNSKTTRNLVMQLMKADVVIIYRQTDDNQTWKVLGLDYGLRLMTATNNSGVALSDRNGFELSFQRNNKELAVDISNSIVESLLVPVS